MEGSNLQRLMEYNHFKFTSNPRLQSKHENLLVFAEIVKIEFISTAPCERAFSIQRQSEDTKNLGSLLKIAFKDLKEGVKVV